MGDTADWLDANPWEDPEFLLDRFCEWKAMYGWDERIEAETDPKKRRKLEREAKAEYLNDHGF